MLGGKNKQPLGYTIVEVMVVLTVSGVMFLIAANFINGKQQRTAFTAGVNEMASEIQDVIEQVTDGRYSDIPLNCKNNGSSTTFPPGPSVGGQGTNSSCVFLGKVLHFIGPGTALHNYEVVSIAGGRVDSSGNPITSLTGVNGADPQIVVPLTTSQAVPQQFDVSDVAVNSGTSHTFAIGFFQSQGSSAAGSVSVQSGAQTVLLYYLKSGQGVTGSPLTPPLTGLSQAKNADICITDGTRKADIGLGLNNNSQLSANVTMGATALCP